MADTWKRWVEAFWFLRGIAAAMTLVALVPKFTDLSRVEFLRAFHALVVRWNDFAAWIGGLIGMIPFLPELDADVVNCIIFTMSIGVPSGIAWAVRLSKTSATLASIGERGYGPATLLCAVVFSSLVAAVFYLGVVAFGGEYVGIPDLNTLGGIITTIAFIPLAGLFGYALVALKGYAKGLVLVVTFVLTMQVLYWLNTPWLTDQINATVESALRGSP